MNKNPLGEKSELPEKYDPDILFPIPRWPSRSLLDIEKRVPLHGFDYWRAYELSWLNSNGRPEVGVGEFFFDAKSENLVESKSLKLYLNSLNNESFKSGDAIAEVIAKDLKGITQSEVVVKIHAPDSKNFSKLDQPPGISIDKHQISVETFQPDATLLTADGPLVENVKLHSNLFRSNCPITGQPDWATFVIDYSGQIINEESLLAYVCSFRNHQSYHEECAELMFRDIMVQCDPDHLILGLNYTRRGGVDINAYRSNSHISPEQLTFRFARQ